MYNDSALVALVKERGVKWKALADAMGLDAATLYRKRMGEIDFWRSEIQACCDFFNVKELNYIFFA